LYDDGRRAVATPRRRQARDRNTAEYALVAAPLAAGPYYATSEIWVWPLPRVSLTWVLEWRAQRLGEYRQHLDVTAFPDAATKARCIWEPAPDAAA